MRTAKARMLILNFSHPLSPEQLSEIERLVGQPIAAVRSVLTQFALGESFIPQAARLIDEVALTAEQWQTEPILVNLPALNYIAGLVLTELHGRMGYFPPIIRLQLESTSLPPRYAVTEIINLQVVRNTARVKRSNQFALSM